MDNLTKPWDRDRPFQRYNSPSFGPKPPLSGDGHTRGTRRPEDFLVRSLLDGIARNELLRLTPSWTTTMDDAEHEVYGKQTRSFQTWTDAPPYQWHRWYDWNFHLEPELPFAWLRGAGNEPAPKHAKEDEHNGIPIIGPIIDKIKGKTFGPRDNVVPGHNMECEWDTGAMGPAPGGMFQNNWVWPMTHEWVWICGRSIYDGGHETHAGLCRSELHPCKAVAAARWEAFKFPDTPHYVPAIRFMFFASKIGGYVDFDTLAPKVGDAYEFIVDLPEKPEGEIPLTVAVGHTPEFPHNTVTLRKLEDPLVHVSYDEFNNASVRSGNKPQPKDPKYKPEVELIPLGDGGDPKKRQVKVKIPLKALADDCPDVDYYGVIVTMGWPDLDGTLAKKVKCCKVEIKNLFKGVIDHDTFAEEWRFKVGVNGRWFQWQFESMHNKSDHALNKTIEIWLDEQDSIIVSSHGAELDLVDDVYFKDRVVCINDAEIEWEKRPPINIPPHDIFDVIGTVGDIVTGRLPSYPARWHDHIDKRPPAQPDFWGVACYPEQRAVVRRLFSLMWTTFNDQNEPLGLVDPGYGSATENANNPFKIKDKSGKQPDIVLRGLSTWEVGDTAELVVRPPEPENADWVDYKLTYTITVTPQQTT